MHDFKLAVISDTVDQNIQYETNKFHIKTHNRLHDQLSTHPINMTLLTHSQIETLQWPQFYFGGEKVKLMAEAQNLTDRRRASAKAFVKAPPLPADIFCKIINQSFGAQKDNNGFIMPYPSGGALYSGQVIVYVKNVEGYEIGAYHYLPLSKQFEKLDALPQNPVEEALFVEPTPEFLNYHFFIFYGSLISSHLSKYGYRGYRLGLLEIGSMYRNLELQIHSSHYNSLASRVWGGFRDEQLAVSLGLDPRIVLPIICQMIGTET